MRRPEEITAAQRANAESLERLRVITDMPFLDEMGGIADCDGSVVYKLEHGTTIGFPVFVHSEIAIQRAFMSKGTVFDWHKHLSSEWLFVYDGTVVVQIGEGDEGRKIDVGDWCYIQPNTQHEVTALVDTWIIGVTMPRAKGYPDARNGE